MKHVDLAQQLVDIGRAFYSRGWVMGTSGNFSAVLATRPLRLLITPSAAHKGRLSARDLLQVDANGRTVGRSVGKPSAETRLHLEIVKASGAGAVLHTHSVWSTILSERHRDRGGLAIQGLEMLKGLDGVTTHDHQEWVPILANDQDMARLSSRVRGALAGYPAAHAILLSGHGLYTWGRTVADAERQIEILEFLFEVIGTRER
jgi:methylthioribulose-1-phosphate dehydratase